MSGSLAYLLGVVNVLFKGIGEKWHLEITDEAGNTEDFSHEEFSLALFANGGFYGGGFHAAPLASVTDGLIDVILIKKVTKPTLLKLILAYRAGKHFQNGKIANKFKKYLIYRKCISAKLGNIKNICSDGEIIKASSADISIVKKALTYM